MHPAHRGVFRFWGSVESQFVQEGVLHNAKLTWRLAGKSGAFPYTLCIDGAQIVDASVRPNNWLRVALATSAVVVATFVICVLVSR